MNGNGNSTKNVKANLMTLPGIKNVEEINLANNIIKSIVIDTESLGKLIVNSIAESDSQELFDFYFKGLSEKARIFFCPYPIFNPRPLNPEELSEKIKDWRKETDWTVLKLVKDEHIIGICLLKKYKTAQPTSGLAINEKFQKKGLGILLQTIINEQVKLLGIKKLTITLAQNNLASLKVHQKVGFKKTNRLVPHFTYVEGVKTIDRYDIEMVKTFNSV